ncbi:class I SAM-dependent methyltransferase, partial [Nocardiopsis sp. NRRL B-16309]|uniref:class I SAM-dependent methyltransferase n=1 Tax=Nocardiopsis sp. NRRL B-16309 TaxID=1519494 RepID=UPI0006C18818
HVEIGPGNAWFLSRALTARSADRPAMDRITLVDYNPAALDVSARRIRRHGVALSTHTADALARWPIPSDSADSLGCCMVTHTLHGRGFADKRALFAESVRVVRPGGTLFGCGILGEADPAPISPAGARMRRLYNTRRNVFHNAADTEAGLIDVLALVCGPAARIRVRAVGAVAVWEVTL